MATERPSSVIDIDGWRDLQLVDGLAQWEIRAMARICRNAVRTVEGCIETGRSPGNHGYVTVYATDYRSVLAHRLVYECTRSRIPHGMQIDHRCRNRLCINPHHLEVVDQAENKRRAGAARTSCPKGHEFSDVNTYVSPKGERRCRECHRAESRARRAGRLTPPQRARLDQIMEERL